MFFTTSESQNEVNEGNKNKIKEEQELDNNPVSGLSKIIAHDYQNLTQDNKIVMCSCEKVANVFLQHLRIDHKCNECQMFINNPINQIAVKRENVVDDKGVEKETNVKLYSCD
ncbi:7950_t:CDS:1, partial [Gigaspora margarita]